MANRVKTPVTKAKSKSCLRFRLLGIIPTIFDIEIKGNKLPTTRQVLLSYLAHLQSKSKQESAKETAMKVKIIYDRARIPTLDPKKMAQEVEKLHKEMLNIL